MSNKKSSTSFLVQGSILAMASIISRIIGLVYRIPLTAIIGNKGNDYYGCAFEIYNILLIISSYSLPLAVSKLVSADMSLGRKKNVYRILKCALIFGLVSGTIAALILFFGAEFITGTIMKTPYSIFAVLRDDSGGQPIRSHHYRRHDLRSFPESGDGVLLLPRDSDNFRRNGL